MFNQDSKIKFCLKKEPSVLFRKFFQLLVRFCKKLRDLKILTETSNEIGITTTLLKALSYLKSSDKKSFFYTEKIKWKSSNSKVVSKRKYISGNCNENIFKKAFYNKLFMFCFSHS